MNETTPGTSIEFNNSSAYLLILFSSSQERFFRPAVISIKKISWYNICLTTKPSYLAFFLSYNIETEDRSKVSNTGERTRVLSLTTNAIFYNLKHFYRKTAIRRGIDASVLKSDLKADTVVIMRSCMWNMEPRFQPCSTKRSI